MNSPVVDIGCGVEERDGEELLAPVGKAGTLGAVIEVGVSITISSLTEELALRGKGGGGVRIRSSNLFQKSGPPEFRKACCEKFED